MLFRQFKHFTGRMRQSNQWLPFNPVPSVPLQHSEAPKIFYETMKTNRDKSACADGLQAPDGRPWHVSPKNWAFMKKLQADLQAPVFLAKGTPDKILFGVTVALAAWGFLDSMYFIWQRATNRI